MAKRRAIDFPGRDIPKVDPFPARGYNVTFNLRTRSLKETRHHLCVDVAPVPPDADDEADAIKVINLLNAASDLLAALKEMLDVQNRRRHPLGLPDEGISYDAAAAASKASVAITKAGG